MSTPTPRPKILAVDDEVWNLKLIEAYLAPEAYEVKTVESAAGALEALEQGPFDLILTDVMMPVMDGFSLCLEIRKLEACRSIPILLVTALDDTAAKVRGLESGASDFLTKPVDRAEIIARVRAHLRIKSLMDEIASWNAELEKKVAERTQVIKKQTKALDESYILTVESLMTALDMRERETGKHSLRVAFYAAELVRPLGLTAKETEEIALGALLHDIGKIGVPDHILLKKDSLEPAEWEQMRLHPEIGWSMIKDIEFFGRGRDLVLQHQERFDGSGYPKKLKGEAIYAGARFFAVADTLDVLMSERSYKKILPFEKSCEIIRQASGIQFDPKAVEIFSSIPPERWEELRQNADQKNFRALLLEIRGRI